MREELIKNRNADPFKLLGVSNEDKLTFFLLKWKFNQSEAETMPKVDLVREFRINDAIRVASGIENVKSFEEKKNCIKIDATKSREEVYQEIVEKLSAADVQMDITEKEANFYG